MTRRFRVPEQLPDRVQQRISDGIDATADLVCATCEQAIPQHDVDVSVLVVADNDQTVVQFAHGHCTPPLVSNRPFDPDLLREGNAGAAYLYLPDSQPVLAVSIATKIVGYAPGSDDGTNMWLSSTLAHGFSPAGVEPEDKSPLHQWLLLIDERRSELALVHHDQWIHRWTVDYHADLPDLELPSGRQWHQQALHHGALLVYAIGADVRSGDTMQIISDAIQQGNATAGVVPVTTDDHTWKLAFASDT